MCAAPRRIWLAGGVTWPDIDRPDPPYAADERTMLEAWLDFHRASLLRKCAGLTGEQLTERAVPPSTLSLLGLVRHLAEVERGWFRGGWQPDLDRPLWEDADDVDADLNATDPNRADADLGVYRREVDLARDEAAGHGLDDATRAPWRSHDVTLRWIYLHMIEEYARHNGHADLLRERIDGATGE